MEQKACDYFFANIFSKEYSDYKVIEFDNETDTSKYWSIVHKCKNWDEKTKGNIMSGTPDKSTKVIAKGADLRVKRRTRNSGRLKVGVWSKIKVSGYYFVLIRVYRKKEFVVYYFIELDSDGNIIETCKQGETI